MKRLCVLSLLLLVFIPAAAMAQPTDARKAVVETAKAKTEKDLEAERILRERRENAESILINLAADATRFNDQTLRARTQARIADVLWDADPEKARTLFGKRGMPRKPSIGKTKESFRKKSRNRKPKTAAAQPCLARRTFVARSYDSPLDAIALWVKSS